MSSPVRQYQPIAQPAASRTDISQSTAVEQSRAIAEVQAMVLVAQQSRRVKDIAVSEMRDSTAQSSVAEKAFFRFPRGGQTVSGPSIHLARELARCWGNIDFGVKELRRDDSAGISEMLAYAWDLETNARNATTFIVPHKRDKRGGAEKLTDMRDIYENNANAGARRLRECIFAVLPPWFIDEASDRCNATLKDGGGVPLVQRVANSIKGFEAIGVTREQLATKMGRPSGEWTEHDVSQLGVIWKSIDRGEVTKDDEFAPARVTADEVRSQRAQTSGTDTPPPQTETSETGSTNTDPDTDKAITPAQLKALHAAFGDQKMDDDGSKYGWLENLFGREFTSSKQLTRREASEAIDTLNGN